MLNTEQVVRAEGERLGVAASGQAVAVELDSERESLVWRALCIFAVAALLVAVTVLFQWRAGAFSAEFSGYPDEASHYLSGLLVHDYVAAGLPSNPVRFARQFYLHYPYLAIGHWPPLFYGVEGVWMLLFSPSRISVMLLMALITAGVAFSLYCSLRREFGPIAAGASAVLLVASPLVQTYSAMVMLDMLMTLLSFWAVLSLIRFFDSGRWQDALGFGLYASLALLTKGNALYLALVPVIAVLLSRRFYLLRRIAFWVPALVVAGVSVPWHLLTMHLMLPTFLDSAGREFAMRAVRFYGGLLERSLGPGVLVLVAVGVATTVITAFTRRQATAKWAVVAAYVISIAIFYCAVPAGIEARYLLSSMPPLFMFFCAGAASIAKLPIMNRITQGWRTEAAIALAIAVFTVTAFAIPMKQSTGFRKASAALMSMPEFRNSQTIVSSETTSGEGMFVSEVAMRGSRSQHVIIRASKVLADNDWNVKYYRPRYRSAEELTSCIAETSIRFIVMDMSPGRWHFEHHQQLIRMLTAHPDQWKRVGVFAEERSEGPVYVYRSTRANRERHAGVSLFSNIITNIDEAPARWPISETLACGEMPAPADARPVGQGIQ